MAKSLPSTKKITSVYLEPEVEGEGDKIKMFFCFNCKVPIIEYTGKVVTIIPGRTPYTPSTILKCKGSVQRRDGDWEECGIYYSFLGSVYTKNPEMTQ